MILNEFSRIAQLNDGGKAKLANGMAEFNLLFASIADHIESVVTAMDAEAFEKASMWYNEANNFAFDIATENGVTVAQAAGIISAMSPRMPWLRNKNVAAAILREFRKYSFLTTAEAAKEIGLGLSTNVVMALKIARGEDISETLTGTKRRSFFNNIVQPFGGDSVTVDTWMVRAIMSTNGMSLAEATDVLRKYQKSLGGTGVGYYAIAEATRTVAQRIGSYPSAVQAAYWISVSGDFNGGRTDIGQE